MAKTYIELNREIEALKAEAQAVFETEVVEVVARIRHAIDVYGLTAEDLGFGSGRPKSAGNGKAEPARKGGPAKKAATASKAPIKYRDEAGNTWSGRGHRPRWLTAALDAGEPLDRFVVPPGEATTSSTRKGAEAKRSAGRSPSVPKYKDDAGHTWSGRGPRPGWFKEAIERGIRPEQMAA